MKLKPINIKKIEIVEIEVLQSELLDFLTYKLSTLNPANEDYLNSVLIIDNLKKLFFDFRNKIERNTKTVATLNLSATESVIMILCCQFNTTLRKPYEKFVMEKIKNQLHEQLINL